MFLTSRFLADEHEEASPDDDDEEVRKLKVCIELKGLRLSKPAAGAASPNGRQIKQERAWPQPQPQPPRLLNHAQSQQRKIRPGQVEDRSAPHRSDINRKWGCEKLPNGKA